MTEQKNKYRTIKILSTGIYKEKGSKFIGIAVPCYTEEEAKEFLDRWRKEHYQARHVCYAYRLGREKEKFRANDDGEPVNSAGAPILGQIKAFELTNILIGVVRYYGGTKLGVGGLINAYRTAAREAIDHGKIVEKEVYHWLQLKFSYDNMPAIMQLLKKYKLEMHSNDFSLSCELVTYVPFSSIDEFLNELGLMEDMIVNKLGIY